MYFCQEKSGLNFDGDSLKIHQGKHILYSNNCGTVMNLLYVSDAYATGLQYHQQYHQRTEHIVLIPLKNSPSQTLGYVTNKKKKMSKISSAFIKKIKKV